MAGGGHLGPKPGQGLTRAISLQWPFTLLCQFLYQPGRSLALVIYTPELASVYVFLVVGTEPKTSHWPGKYH